MTNSRTTLLDKAAKDWRRSLNWVHCSSCGESFCTSSAERAASIVLGFCHVHRDHARPAGFIVEGGSYVLVDPIDRVVFTTLREAQESGRENPLSSTHIYRVGGWEQKAYAFWDGIDDG